jgi:hypothetical protein
LTCNRGDELKLVTTPAAAAPAAQLALVPSLEAAGQFFELTIQFADRGVDLGDTLLRL